MRFVKMSIKVNTLIAIIIQYLMKTMKSIITLLLPILGALLFSAAFAKKEATQLNDENFESITKAAAGNHDGEWLILFCELQRFPEKCAHLLPLWNELVDALPKTHVAYVDV